VTSLVDAFLSPVYGAVISGTKPMKWGRNRSWIKRKAPSKELLLTLYTLD